MEKIENDLFDDYLDFENQGLE